jgi:hypothetical protein
MDQSKSVDERIEDMSGTSEVVQRALGYPYSIPSRSFALAGGRAVPLEAVDVDLSERTPLLAYGSNAAPEVLARKLGAGADPVPVVRAVLSGFDVVYSAHISAYGSVPAAIQHSPGTEVRVFVAHLTAEQLRGVSETEPNYELRSLRGVDVRLGTSGSLSELAAYVSRHGCLVSGGSEVALSSVEARGRRFPEMSEAQVLERVRRELCPDRSVEALVSLAAADPETARRLTARLRAAARNLDLTPPPC